MTKGRVEAGKEGKPMRKVLREGLDHHGQQGSALLRTLHESVQSTWQSGPPEGIQMPRRLSLPG